MSNLKKAKKYHFTYKTTNLITNRYYLGMHSTNRLDDGYVGSGKRLWYELRKYGRDNFTIEILKYYNSREELVEAEKKLITEEILTDKNCLNLKIGGSGGLCNEKHKQKWSNAGTERIRKLHKESPEFREAHKGRAIERWKSLKYREDLIKKLKDIHKKRGHGTFKGKTHSEETKSKMKGHKRQQGEKNSMYGRKWIHNDNLEETKPVLHTEIKKYLKEEWKLGRKLYKDK